MWKFASVEPVEPYEHGCTKSVLQLYNMFMGVYILIMKLFQLYMYSCRTLLAGCTIMQQVRGLTSLHLMPTA
jgi:hypothetical protein